MDKKKMENNQQVKIPNIYLYYANIMDYFRIIATAVSFCIARKCPFTFFFLYFLSFTLDAYDGDVARRFKQTSRLGATLDMVTDRISTAGLICVLSSFYLDYAHVFCLLMMLDVGSHWMQTHSHLLANPKNENHKGTKEIFYLLDIYYNNRKFLGICCIGAEIFLLLLYIAHFYTNLFTHPIFMPVLYVTGAIYSLKQFISILQVFGAADRIKKFDEHEYLEKNSNKKSS